jgi:O-methyltransferase involved in polyketide biosynthesis
MAVLASSFDKISPTALLVAYARQFSDIPFASAIAQQVHAESVLQHFEVATHNPLVPLGALIEARYKAVNRLVIKFGYSQILELASGLLPRGMIMTQDLTMTYVESDLLAMLEQKKALAQHLVGTPPNLHYEVVDATAIPSQFPLQAAYLDASQPIAILCEGLMQYLTFPEKEQLCRNIREMLQRFGGVWITSDFTTKLRQEGLYDSNPGIKDLFRAIGQLTGRSLEETGFRDRAQVDDFIAQQGFQVEEISLLDVFDELTCLQPLNIPPASVKPILTATHVFALTLKSSESSETTR